MDSLTLTHRAMERILKEVIEDRFSTKSFPGAEEGSVELVEREIRYFEELINDEKKEIKRVIKLLYNDDNPYILNIINDKITVIDKKISIYKDIISLRKMRLNDLKSGIKNVNNVENGGVDQ